jgi:hypothetical protein
LAVVLRRWERLLQGRRASMNLLGLWIWRKGAPEQCGDDGVRKLGFLPLWPKSKATQALYTGFFVRRSPICVGLISKPFNSIESSILLRFFSWGKSFVSSKPSPILVHRSYVREEKSGAVMTQVRGHRSGRLQAARRWRSPTVGGQGNDSRVRR